MATSNRLVTPQEATRAREIGARLRQVIAASGLSQCAFARKLGISQSYVSQVCLGKVIPAYEWINHVCRESGVSVSWLKDGAGDFSGTPPVPRPDPGTVGDRIRQVREAYGMTQAEFGFVLQTSQATVAQWELALHAPSPKWVRTICRKFCIPESWLCTGEGDVDLAHSHDERMRMSFERVLAEQDSSFRRRTFFALLELSDIQWHDLERFAKKIFKEGTP